MRRILTISLLSAGVLIINTFYIQLIGSGTGMYSYQFEIEVFLNIKEILFLIWSNVSHLFWIDNLLYDNFIGMSLIVYKNGTNEILNENISIEKKKRTGKWW